MQVSWCAEGEAAVEKVQRLYPGNKAIKLLLDEDEEDYLRAVERVVAPYLRVGPDLDLKDGGRDSSFSLRGSRSRSVLVVAQVAFALAVLIVSGLIVRTVNSLEHVPLGITPDGVLTTRVRFEWAVLRMLVIRELVQPPQPVVREPSELRFKRLPRLSAPTEK